MSIIEDLWYGNIAPWERETKRSSEYADVLERIVQIEADLHARLNDEEKEILEKFVNYTNEMCCISEREMFVQGFMLGAKLIIEVMTSENE
jgi:hypothetical protein